MRASAKRTGVKNQRRQTPKAVTSKQIQHLLALESPPSPSKLQPPAKRKVRDESARRR
ncbi:hypothetical protein [Tychonema sp. LEGE 07203]|uniref:hypothetical protein n=1 Tax=Tychonema sp. LEGE 07203 TaxID=1828671 RepID=UPI00187F546C|nr:hypothetical protein [Tychonema sp. LEGE 07203]MBE9092697.1 hypothetical protein [Tychonema sp. LEGE 07203]